MEPRTTVLLGAGASKDAGLPLTVDLAVRLVEGANLEAGHRGRPDWVSALNFVYGSMVGYQAEDGGNPLGAVNIERLVSALRLLQNRSDHEVAPFVSAWKAGALGVGTTNVDAREGKALENAIGQAVLGRAFGGSNVAEIIARIAKAVTGQGDPAAFREAEEKILDGLSDLLGAPESVDYLSPLADLARVQRHGLDIITLNYDLTVEQMATETNTEIERGIGTYRPGVPMDFTPADARINLYKLHGSLDWVERTHADGVSAPLVEERSDDASRPGVGWPPRLKPWIVVGDREKLATDGPTLALLRAAEEALQRTTHLVVVGYSFSDDHINSIVRNWMLGDSDRTMGIVDTRWAKRDLGEFRTALLNRYGCAPDRKSRVLSLDGFTRDRLKEALERRPDVTPATYASVGAPEDVEGVLRIPISLFGPDLHEVTIAVNSPPDHPNGFWYPVDTFWTAVDARASAESPGGIRSVATEKWICGSEVQIFVRGPLEAGSTVLVRGRRLDGVADEALRLEID